MQWYNLNIKEYVAYKGEKWDKEQALAAKEDYIKRVKEGVYYEDE